MIQLFNYKGNEVTFRNENDVVFINATEMAKPFKKRPSKWLELPSVKHFLSELSDIRKSDITNFIRTLKGNFSDGRLQGTWLHEDVALEFSRWLSPSFAIWCNDRIKELMKYGFTATSEKLEEMLINPELIIELASQLKQEREENLK